MAVSDVNMSSEGSESSTRLRQFGLYKTIDSRTAEFLKLSRKRQIRRGCACAAVSTAITVTVVVSALLVYEYGFHTDSKMAPNTLRKFNWFNVVNASDATFDKNKDALANNRNNNKLLPIILKALDQKRYLETLIEELSTTPAYEITTDYTLEKNLFTDPRNWKVPLWKLSEAGYKGPPQGFFKQRHADSFTNARKLIDYQRIMTYLNAMSINTKDEEPTHITKILKPSSSTGSYKNDFLFQYNHHKSEPDKREIETTEATVTREKNDIDAKEKDGKYCKCKSNNSNLADILKNLYNSIQQLHPRKIEKAPTTEICNKPEPENNAAAKIHRPFRFFNLRAPISMRNLTNITKQKKISFTRISNNTMALNPELTQIPESNADITNNFTNEQNMSVVSNDSYFRPGKNRANRFKEVTIPSKFDFETNEVTTVVYMHTDKAIDIATTTAKYTAKINRQIKDKEIMTTEKEGGGVGGGFDDEERDYADEIDHLSPENNKYLNTHFEHVNKEKSKVFEQYNYLANYMDGLSKLSSKTNLVDKTDKISTVQTSTAKPFDLKRFFSYETDPLFPLEKLQKSSTESPHTFKPLQWLSEKQKISTSKYPPAAEPKQRSGKNIKKAPLQVPRTDKVIRSKTQNLDINTEVNTQPYKNVLIPMIESYLLSKHDSGLLNLKFDTTTSVNTESSKGSEELPFNLRLYSDEEGEHIYANLINNIGTSTPVVSTKPYDKGKSGLKTNTSKESASIKEIKNKRRPRKRKLPKVQTTTPPTINYPKAFSKPPVKTEPKKHKVKELFYMTGSETPPPDEFETNLHELMYFERSPINYTALSDSFLNQTDSGSIEITKSMMPETRPSYLEIRRHHDELDFDTQLYSYKQQN